MDQENKKIVMIIIIAIVVLLLVGGGLYFGLAAAGDKINDDLNVNSTTPVNSANSNSGNGNENTNTNSASNSNVTTSQQVTITGRVFTKGYGTPSESFGILSTDGLEIGLGDYDSMREQIRPYIGEDITVTYDRVCTSSAEGCCRTVFPLCGDVLSWEPVE